MPETTFNAAKNLERQADVAGWLRIHADTAPSTMVREMATELSQLVEAFADWYDNGDGASVRYYIERD